MSFIAQIMLGVILSMAALVCPHATAEARSKGLNAKQREGAQILKHLEKFLEKIDHPLPSPSPLSNAKIKSGGRIITGEQKGAPSPKRNTSSMKKEGENILQRLDRLIKNIDEPIPSPSPTQVPVIAMNVTLGNQVPIGGFSPFQPSLDVQLSDGSKFAVSLGANILRGYVGKTTMGAFGVMGAVHYFSKSPFEGWWAQFGIGLYGIHAKTNGLGIDWNFRFKSPTLMITIGHRFKFDNGLNIGIGGGVLYMDRWGIVPGSEFNGIKPILTLDFGYSFPL